MQNHLSLILRQGDDPNRKGSGKKVEREVLLFSFVFNIFFGVIFLADLFQECDFQLGLLAGGDQSDSPWGLELIMVTRVARIILIVPACYFRIC